MPVFGPFAFLPCPVSLLLISVFYPHCSCFFTHSVSHVFDLSHLLLQSICYFTYCRWQIGPESKSQKRIFAYIRSILLRPSWETFISCIDHHYEQVMAEYLVLLFTVFNYLLLSHVHAHAQEMWWPLSCNGWSLVSLWNKVYKHLTSFDWKLLKHFCPFGRAMKGYKMLFIHHL
jgi:hypothetical protein